MANDARRIIQDVSDWVSQAWNRLYDAKTLTKRPKIAHGHCGALLAKKICRILFGSPQKHRTLALARRSAC